MKKASIFVVGIVIISFLILVSAFGVMFLKYSRTGNIGDKQLLLTKAYLEGEKALLYVDTVAEQAYEQAANGFASDIGFDGVSSCNVDGINIINSDCDFDEETIKESFNKHINAAFNQYFRNYEEAYIPFNLYEFYEYGDEILGIARHPAVVLIGSSAENVNCFPGLLQYFPVSGSYVMDDTWGSEEMPDAARINVRNPDTAVVAVADGEIRQKGVEDGKEFIEITTGEYVFRYSNLEVSNAMIRGGAVDAGEPIGSSSGYIYFQVYRDSIPMNPVCSLQRIRQSNPVQGYYHVGPDIILEPEYDLFEDFNIVMETAEEITDDCGDDISCIKNKYDNKKINDDLILHVGDCEGNGIMDNAVIGFCVESQDEEKSTYVYEETTTITTNPRTGIDRETTTVQPVLVPLQFRFAIDTSRDFKATEISLAEQPTTHKTPGKATPIEAIPEEITGTKVIWPVEATISSCFGYRQNPITESGMEWTGGTDFSVPEGTKVKAVADGTVYQTAKQADGYGFNVVIKHTSSFYTRYSHLSKILVDFGDKVKQGDIIALSGNTGRSTGPHLDFRVHLTQDLATAPEKNYDWDPFCFLPKSSGQYSSPCKEHQCKISLESLYSST